MAEVTAFRNNALPYPIYGAPFTIVFPILDADGDPVTGAATLDAEVSLNGDTFVDVTTNESTEIATNSGIYYLTILATQMTADIVTVRAQTSTVGAKTTVSTLYPRKLVTVRSGTTQGGSASTIQLDASASALDDYYNGMVCIATIDSVVEVRIIGDYTGSTKTATVEGPNWVQASPDADDTFVIKLPEGAFMHNSNVTAWQGESAPVLQGGRVDVYLGSIDSTPVGTIATGVLDEAIEGSMALRQIMRILLAESANKLAGAATTTVTFRDLADTKDRITATVDSSGNRTAITLDAT